MDLEKLSEWESWDQEGCLRKVVIYYEKVKIFLILQAKKMELEWERSHGFLWIYSQNDLLPIQTNWEDEEDEEERNREKVPRFGQVMVPFLQI